MIDLGVTMKLLTDDDKRKIVARNFYNDNLDTYKNYQEAYDEMGQVPIDFLNSGVQITPFVPDPGYRSVMKDGNILFVNDETGHVLPCTEMSNEDGEKIQLEFSAKAEEFPDELSAYKLLEKMGWKLIHDLVSNNN